jgi:hypothetical protein
MKLEEVKKVAIGVTVYPETFRIFKAGAQLFNVNLSQFLSMVIHRRNEEGFVYYDVDPRHGEVGDSTTQTLLYVSEDQRALLQGWADRENSSLTSIVRCLMDITVNKMLAYDREIRDSSGRVRDEPENQLKVEIFQQLERMGVQLSEIIDTQLEEFEDAPVREMVEGYTRSSLSIFDSTIPLTEKQLSILEEIANRQRVEVEKAKDAFELSLLAYLVDPRPRFCHVAKEEFLELKRICQRIGSTPSKLLNRYVWLLKEPQYHSPELAKDVVLQRVNVALEGKTSLALEHFCALQGIKMAEAIRLLVHYISNFFKKDGIQLPDNYVF